MQPAEIVIERGQPIEIFNNIGQSGSREEVFAILRRYFGDLGFGAIGYLAPSKTEPGRVEIEAYGFPETWIARYRGGNLDTVDPFPRFVARSGRPQKLSEIASTQKLSRDQNAFRKEARSHGMTDGFLIPTFGIRQHLGIFAMGQIDSLTAMENVNVYVLQAVAQAAHTQLERLSEPSNVIRPNLSDREVSILHWIAVGKTNGEIATILGIGIPTVATYIKRTFHKLDVTDRSSAATKAIRLGIISI